MFTKACKVPVGFEGTGLGERLAMELRQLPKRLGKQSKHVLLAFTQEQFLHLPLWLHRQQRTLQDTLDLSIESTGILQLG